MGPGGWGGGAFCPPPPPPPRCSAPPHTPVRSYLDIERTELSQNLAHTKFWAARGKRCRALSRRLFNAYRVTLSFFVVNVVLRCKALALASV